MVRINKFCTQFRVIEPKKEKRGYSKYDVRYTLRPILPQNTTLHSFIRVSSYQFDVTIFLHSFHSSPLAFLLAVKLSKERKRVPDVRA